MTHLSLTIARREIRETSTDWRILSPLLILTFLIPLVVLGGVRSLPVYRQDPAAASWLMPLALLLCGFLPAGFSLVNASESFVGEKERYTLEALMATPMTDRDLYFGKLIAAILPPLCSALLAMGTFATAQLLTIAPLPAASLEWRLGLTLAILVSLKVVVLVAVTMIISMHATTIRAANLLASFALVPMALLVQIEGLLMAGDQARYLPLIVAALALIAVALIRTGLATLDREALLSREHAGFDWRRIGWTFRRFLAEYRPAGVIPERYRGAFSLRRFYATELSALIRDYRAPLACMSIALTVGLVLGALAWLDRTSYQDPQTLLAAPGRAESAISNLGLNLRVAVIANLLSIVSLGIFSFFGTGLIAMRVGFAVMGQTALGSSSLTFLPYLLTHTVLILPAMLFSGALGLRIGMALLHRRREFTLGQHMLWSLANFLKVFALVIVPVFALAALIEAVLRVLMAQYVS